MKKKVCTGKGLEKVWSKEMEGFEYAKIDCKKVQSKQEGNFQKEKRLSKNEYNSGN
ncbi:MAG: hypothetical protein J6C37_09635 [Roseburia sp.]|nr:hypothetical protein [Roseburia sp.]